MARKTLLLAMALATVTSSSAIAHFQSLYTPEANLAAPRIIPIDLIFWHPQSSGAVMNMGQPREFFMIHRGERTDLMDLLQPITFTTEVNSGAAFRADVELRGAGDYILAMVPEPYYEDTEDIYIQQITKTYVNRGQLPTDWDQPVGLPTEIVPHNKPYNVITGSTFSGQVLSNGEPVAGATIEVEYISITPDMDSHTAAAASLAPMPGGAIDIVTDGNGNFTFGIPRAGWWGLAALDIGPDTEFEGKHLSQDAVIWVSATDLAPIGPAFTAVGPFVAARPPPQETQVAATATAASRDVINQVSRSMRDQLRPIRTDLAVYRARNSYPVILGGIGFIVGLAGLGFYVFANQRARQGKPQRA